MRRRISVFVVLDEDDHGHAVHGGEVDRLMEIPGAGRPVADVGQAHGRQALHPPGHDPAGDDRDHRAQVGDHRVDALLQVAEMHIAIAAAGRSGGAGQPLAEDIEDALATAQMHGDIADTRGKQVVRSRSCRRCSPDRLLPNPRIDPPVDLALMVKADMIG